MKAILCWSCKVYYFLSEMLGKNKDMCIYGHCNWW